MGQHDLQAKEVQLETIISRGIERIFVFNILSYTEDYVFTANDLVTLQRVQQEIQSSSSGTGMIAPYDPDVPTNQNYPVTYFIDGTRYIFISQIDDNVSVPGFTNDTYQVAGLYKLPLIFDQTALIEESYGGVWYLPVDTNNRDIISIGVSMAATPGITNYIDQSQVYTDLTLTPSTRISGFSSNAPQTITIKTI